MYRGSFEEYVANREVPQICKTQCWLNKTSIIRCFIEFKYDSNKQLRDIPAE